MKPGPHDPMALSGTATPATAICGETGALNVDRFAGEIDDQDTLTLRNQQPRLECELTGGRGPARGTPIPHPIAETHQAADGAPFRRLPHLVERPGYALHYGNACKPMARVAPDANWQGMWRMIWPDETEQELGIFGS